MIFVFGSNLAGRHGKGAALYARQHHGAIYGQGVGAQGNSYAIPTKDGSLKTLSLEAIAEYVDTFKLHASTRLHEQFEVTAIGCGLAGYSPKQIAPMFAGSPQNCRLPMEFRIILEGAQK
jgi:hypothetical protein